MPQRLAAVLSLVAFTACLLIGTLEADNPFSTTVVRALVAMVFTLVIGLIVGSMGQKMIDDNLKAEQIKLLGPSAEKSEKKATDDR